MGGVRPGGLEGDADAAVLAHAEFLGEQRVDGLEGADLAAFEAPHDVAEGLQGARHVQADEVGLDAVEQAARRCCSGVGEALADGGVEVQRALRDRPRVGLPARPGRRAAVARIEPAQVPALEDGMRGDEGAVLEDAHLAGMVLHLDGGRGAVGDSGRRDQVRVLLGERLVDDAAGGGVVCAGWPGWRASARTGG